MDDHERAIAIPDHPSVPELKLYVRALRNDWPIPERVKQRILETACSLIESDGDPLPPQSELVSPAVPPRVDADGREVSPGVAEVRRDNTEFRSEIGTRHARVRLAAMRVLAQFTRLNAEQGKLDLMRAKYQHDHPVSATTDGAGGRIDVTQLTDEQLRIIIEQGGARS